MSKQEREPGRTFVHVASTERGVYLRLATDLLANEWNGFVEEAAKRTITFAYGTDDPALSDAEFEKVLKVHTGALVEGLALGMWATVTGQLNVTIVKDERGVPDGTDSEKNERQG